MTEEIQDVNQEASQAEIEASTIETEQDSNVSEDVQTQTSDGKDYKTIAENLSRALREERAKNKTQEVAQPQPVQPVISEDETVKRFLNVEATTKINNKILTDPSFKDRAPIVTKYVEQGYDVDMADNLALADIMRGVLNESSEPVKPNIPKTPQPIATQEQVRPQPTGNTLDDIQTGKVEVQLEGISRDELSDILAKYRPKE